MKWLFLVLVLAALAILLVVAIVALRLLRAPTEPVSAPLAGAIPAAKPPAPAQRQASSHDDDEITIVSFAPMVLDEKPSEPQPAPEATPADDTLGKTTTIVRDPAAADDEPSSSFALILLSSVGQTNRGRKRKNNEDSFLVLQDHHLFVVADGMGGYAGGEVASKLAVDTIEQAYRDDEPFAVPEGAPRDGAQLSTAIQKANRAIFERASADPELKGMGTTVVGARFSPTKERVYIGHVGDSRCYRLRKGELQMLTTDHTLAAMGVEGPNRHSLTRATGIAPQVEVDLVLAEPDAGDTWLLCSDGLTKMVPEDVIRDVLRDAVDAEVAVQALINEANARGGKDNITVIVVQVRSPHDIDEDRDLTTAPTDDGPQSQ